MSKTTIKAEIDANITQNGTGAISGNILNGVLNDMVDNYAEQEEVTDIKTKTEDISKVSDQQTTEESVEVEDQDGNIVLHIDANGVDAKNLKSNGKEVLTEQNLETLATKEEVAEKQDKIDKISESETQDEEEYVSIENNDGSDVYAKVGKDGIETRGLSLISKESKSQNIPFQTTIYTNQQVFSNLGLKKGDVLLIEAVIASGEVSKASLSSTEWGNAFATIYMGCNNLVCLTNDIDNVFITIRQTDVAVGGNLNLSIKKLPSIGGDSLSFRNTMRGKKAVWFGTSIPATGYPQMVGGLNGMQVFNEAFPSSMCRSGAVVTEDAFGDDIGCSEFSWDTFCYSLSLSQREKLKVFQRWTAANRKARMIDEDGYTAEQVANVQGYGDLMRGTYVSDTDLGGGSKPEDIMSDEYVDLRKTCYGLSWDSSNNIETGFGIIEGRVEKYLSQDTCPDIWFFDHGFNDKYGDNSNLLVFPEIADDRHYFIGAMNFIFKKILMFNPNAKIVLIGHYGNETLYNINKVCEAQQKLASYWQFPFVKTWELLPFSLAEVTTKGYWDDAMIWHNDGFDGTNHKGLEIRKYQLQDGTWVHDMTMRQIYMRDDLHPLNKTALSMYARALSSNINSLI